MGRIVKAKCTSCAFEKTLHIGGGRRDCDLDVILAPLDESARSLVEGWLASGTGRVSISRPLCVCQTCGAPSAPEIVSYTTADGMRSSFFAACDACGGDDHIRLTDDGKKLTDGRPAACPKCGAALSFEPAGHWD